MSRWRKATVDEIPPAGPRNDLEFWAPWRNDPEFGRNWHSVREFFGIRGFGCSANTAAAGEELAAGELLYVPPEVERQARALETPTVVFVAGGTPGRPYRHWLDEP